MNKTYKNCWEHFGRGKEKDIAACKLCAKSLSCKGSSSTGLHRHLESKHGLKRRNEECETNFDSVINQIIFKISRLFF